ncbi:MAG TPA: ATP-binding cassette domain-containing protein, partial [Steroidobacteraceae bacterium]|nr:ATP-binding cassette domain-containing protein [Steroidobacteraceae bacterium]
MPRLTAADTRYVEVRLKRIHLERAGRPVLHEVDWTIRPGERWVLAGGNGAGKTQLLKLVSGAVWPTPTGRESRRYLWRREVWPTPAEVKEEIGYVGAERQDKYERYGWNHGVAQIVGTGLYRTDIPLNPLSAADQRRILALLKRVGIAHLAERGFLSLSYGERRLTLLARTLASQPKLLLLDELLNGLDETNQARALKWLESTGRSRLPWVLATHRAGDIPSCATHALILDGGRVVYRGSIAKAPLARWLEHEPLDKATPRLRSKTSDARQ